MDINEIKQKLKQFPCTKYGVTFSKQFCQEIVDLTEWLEDGGSIFGDGNNDAMVGKHLTTKEFSSIIYYAQSAKNLGSKGFEDAFEKAIAAYGTNPKTKLFRGIGKFEYDSIMRVASKTNGKDLNMTRARSFSSDFNHARKFSICNKEAKTDPDIIIEVDAMSSNLVLNFSELRYALDLATYVLGFVDIDDIIDTFERTEHEFVISKKAMFKTINLDKLKFKI